MEVKIIVDGEVSVLSVSGRLDIERNQFFRNALVREFKNRKIIFNMEKVNFVGSTGIQAFFSCLNELNAQKMVDVKVVGLKPDFQRLLNYSNISHLRVYENVEGAMQSFLGLVPDLDFADGALTAPSVNPDLNSDSDEVG